jgi:hypothetical protein
LPSQAQGFSVAQGYFPLLFLKAVNYFAYKEAADLRIAYCQLPIAF